jgi:hypothetical protein
VISKPSVDFNTPHIHHHHTTSSVASGEKKVADDERTAAKKHALRCLSALIELTGSRLSSFIPKVTLPS